MTRPLTSRLRQGQRVLLVVEDDPDTANLLAMYFAGHGYHVETAARGADGVDLARRHVPDVVLLDIGLPDLDGLAVCQALRAAPRTAHIPVIYLSERATLEDRVAGLGSGAQDYVTKPFDLEELRLRVHNLVARAARDRVSDPRTGLPTGRWVEEQRAAAARRPGWHSLECQVEGFQTFVDLYGFVAGDEVLKFAGQLLREAVHSHGTPEDFVGHPANDTFVILSCAAAPEALAQHLKARFDDEVRAHYSFLDREQGYVLVRMASGQSAPVPLMTLSVRAAAPAGH